MRSDSPPMIGTGLPLVNMTLSYTNDEWEATGCRLLRVGEYLLYYVSVPRPLHRVLHLSLGCDSCRYESIIIINTNK